MQLRQKGIKLPRFDFQIGGKKVSGFKIIYFIGNKNQKFNFWREEIFSQSSKSVQISSLKVVQTRFDYH